MVNRPDKLLQCRIATSRSYLTGRWNALQVPYSCDQDNIYANREIAVLVRLW